MTSKLFNNKISKYIMLAFFIIVFIIGFISFDINLIREFIYDVVGGLDENRFFNLILILLLFLLRSFSIIIPVLPGTIFSVAAGFQFGFSQGLVIIFCADFLSCSTSFLLAR